MIQHRRSLPALVLFLAAAACGGSADPLSEAEGAAGSNGGAFRYDRDYVFLAVSADPPVVVPFSFQAADVGSTLRRSVRGWLARGGTWDRFLDEEAATSRAGGVWRIVPDGDLTVLAGGPTELEGLRFERGERRLHLDVGAPLTGWNEGGETRFRLLRGRLTVGAEGVAGTVLETLRVDRTVEDGWPEPVDYDALFLASGDSIQLVMGETVAGGAERDGFSWLRVGEVERTWDEGEVRWTAVEAFQDARRDIPERWSLRVPGAGIVGELEAAGFDALLGPERGARRAVEIRFTVTGWVEIDGARHDVAGTIRHVQR